MGPEYEFTHSTEYKFILDNYSMTISLIKRNETKLHILGAFYATNLMTYVLSRTSKSLNPTLYGSEVVNDLLVLQFENDLIPEEVTITCDYSKCATQAPPCRQRHLPCYFFCKCRSNVYSTDSEWRNRLG